MSEKLELKHLAAYLPYGLKVTLEFMEDSNIPWYYEDKDIFTLEGMMLDWWSSDGKRDITSITPIVRRISDLTKEITHNGESFIPMVELLKIHQTDEKYGTTAKYDKIKIWDTVGDLAALGGEYFRIRFSYECTDDVTVICDLTYDTLFNRFTLRQKSPIEKQQWLSYKPLEEKLLEWHFDVFGLIDKGLALNKLDYITPST